MNKSADAFRTIREVADWLGVAAHVLRFWESKFPQVKPVKRAGGRRYYRPSDMQLLGGIKVLLHDRGMTVRGVQRLLREEGTASVAALSPPLEPLEASPDLVEGIGEEAPWHADAAADRASAGAAPAPRPAAPEPPPSLPGFEPTDLPPRAEAERAESQADKAAALLAQLAADEDADAPSIEAAPDQPPEPKPEPEPDRAAKARPTPDPAPETAPDAAPSPEPERAEPEAEPEVAATPEPTPETAPEPEPLAATAPEPAAVPGSDVMPELDSDSAPEPEVVQAPSSEPVFASGRGIDRAAQSPAFAPSVRIEGAGLDALAAFAAAAGDMPPDRRARLTPAISALRALRARIGAPVDQTGGPGAP
jgi:DNA-binding transcriptional MerR regulator